MAGGKVYLAPTSTDTGPQRSLILAGGGMRVAYQAGVLRALFESGLTFAHADGTSGGTMNLGMLLSGLSPVEMCDRWRTLDVKHFTSLMPIEDYLKPWDTPALGDARGIVEHVFPHLGIDIQKINAATGMQGTFNVCNYTRKTSETIPHQRMDLDLLVAGISLPIFMPPVEKDGCLYLDSVWIKDANLLEAVRRGADELWVVWCIGNIRQYKSGVFNQYVHMIELSANGHMFEEFNLINEINARIAAGETVCGHTKPIRLHIIKPEYPLPLDPDYYLGRIEGAELVDMGYADGKRYLQGRCEEGLPLTPEATQMRDPKLGISFREALEGRLSLHGPDASTGEIKEGESPVALHAAVSIHDLSAFMSDPSHAAALNGHISFTPWGEDLPAKSGSFKLFPADGSTQQVVYEMTFEHSGQEYYLVGRREVRSHAGLHDLWSAATTVKVQLRRGSGEGAPVIGDGVLNLSATEMVKSIRSMHATNAGSAAEGAQALLSFGRFFLGELWEKHQGEAPGQGVPSRREE